MAQPCIGNERADLVLAGCAILEAMLQTWPCERLRVADRGLREGILATLMAEDGVYRSGGRSGYLAALEHQHDHMAAAAGRSGRRAAPAQGAAQDRQAAHRLLAALARAPAQRSLRGRGQARGLPLARGLQADRDRRQAPPAQAGQARRRPRRGAGRLEPGGGRARAGSRRARARWWPSTCWTWSRCRASSSCSSTSWTSGARPAQGLLRDGAADVVLSDMAAQGTGHTAHRPSAHHGAGGGGGRVRLRGAAPGGAFVCKVLQGGTERELLDQLKRAFATVRHVKPPASRAESAELYVVATGFRPGRSWRAGIGLQRLR